MILCIALEKGNRKYGIFDFGGFVGSCVPDAKHFEINKLSQKPK